MKPWTKVSLGLAVPILAIVGYAAATAARPNPFFPPIPVMLKRFSDLWLFKRVPTDVLPSLCNFLVGYTIALAVGLIVGIIVGQVRWLNDMAQPLIHFGRSVPPIMLIPPLVLVLGIGDTSKVFVIALGAAFPVILTTIDGMRQVDPALIDMSKSIKLNRVKTLRSIILPAASPAIFGGAQTALQVALILMVSSEMVAATHGVGYLTMQAQSTFNAPSVWAGILLLALLGFLINLAFSLVRNRALAWHTGRAAAYAAS